MNRRWPALVVLVIGELALLGHAYVSRLGDGFPFATAYHWKYAGLVTLGGACALACTWAFTRGADRRTLRGGLGVTAGVVIAAIAAYVPYHLRHGPLFIPDGFRGHPERVTPFHQQLAVPVFLTLGFAAAILAIALVTSARRKRA